MSDPVRPSEFLPLFTPTPLISCNVSETSIIRTCNNIKDFINKRPELQELDGSNRGKILKLVKTLHRDLLTHSSSGLNKDHLKTVEKICSKLDEFYGSNIPTELAESLRIIFSMQINSIKEQLMNSNPKDLEAFKKIKSEIEKMTTTDLSGDQLLNIETLNQEIAAREAEAATKPSEPPLLTTPSPEPDLESASSTSITPDSLKSDHIDREPIRKKLKEVEHQFNLFKNDLAIRSILRDADLKAGKYSDFTETDYPINVANYSSDIYDDFTGGIIEELETRIIDLANSESSITLAEDCKKLILDISNLDPPLRKELLSKFIQPLDQIFLHAKEAFVTKDSEKIINTASGEPKSSSLDHISEPSTAKTKQSRTAARSSKPPALDYTSAKRALITLQKAFGNHTSKDKTEFRNSLKTLITAVNSINPLRISDTNLKELNNLIQQLDKQIPK